MSNFETKDNSGALFTNNKKADNHPDFSRIVPCPPRRSRLASRVSRRVVARVVARASRRDVSRIVSRVSRARLARARLAIDRAPSRRRGRSNTISILACNRAALHGDSSPFKAGSRARARRRAVAVGPTLYRF